MIKSTAQSTARESYTHQLDMKRNNFKIMNLKEVIIIYSLVLKGSSDKYNGLGVPFSFL